MFMYRRPLALRFSISKPTILAISNGVIPNEVRNLSS
jgi:hypothetical protein